MKLTQLFYRRDVLNVARDLVGKIIVKKVENKLYSAKIVEVEAYRGIDDMSAHSYIGITERNKVMFEPGGLLYVYFTYGMYYCCNVVTGLEGEGDAVLIRAAEPLKGLQYFSSNRFGKTDYSEKDKINMLNGPGKFCMAFGINKNDNGTNLTGNQIYILDSEKIEDEFITVNTRIGIKKSKELKWRFYLKNNQYVSKK